MADGRKYMIGLKIERLGKKLKWVWLIRRGLALKAEALRWKN